MRRRIFGSMVLNAVVILLASAVLIMGVLYSYFEKRLETELQNTTNYIAQGVLLDGTDYLESLDSGASRITWIDSDGTVLYDSDEDASQMENHAQREEIREAFLTGRGSSIRYSETLSQKQVYYAQRLSDGTVLRVSNLQYTVWVLVLQILQPVALVLFVALILALFLAGRLSRQIIEPINALDLQHPETAKTYDELSPLLSKIHSQNRQIQDQIEELRRKQEEFTAITENMNEGLVAVDEQTRVLSCNSAALRLLDASLPEGDEEVSVYALDRSGEFQAVVDEALKGQRCEKIMEKGDRCIQVLASPVEEKGAPAGAVLIFWDATEREQRESLRREFTANVSHELKTPLTSILGTAEILENGMVKPEDIGHFAGNIRREVQRLIDLVSDIIKLSRLDAENVELERKPVDLYVLCRGVREQLRTAAEKKNITVDLEGGPVAVRGVPQVLEEMIYNLCDNAIAYNRNGGHVKLTAERVGRGARVVVEDNGVGIARDQQERVFERFYRVDKSHSGRGTGLGLSIVKHGAAFHGAQVSLQSHEGEGTTVTLTFPEAE